MTTVIATLVLVLLLAPVVALLERTHRRTCGWPHGPLGSDVDADLERVRAEVEALRG